MLTDLFLRGHKGVAFDQEERILLEQTISEVRTIPARRAFVHKGKVLHESTLLLDGFMTRSIDDTEGQRQAVSFQVPGDFVDLHGYPLGALDHDIWTLTEARVALVPHRALDQLIGGHPRIAFKLWYSTLLDASMHREWLFRLGRLDAAGRVAHFFMETDARLKAVGLSDGRSYRLPITQLDLADVTGLTSIHVNRVLRHLREQQLCTFRAGTVKILDPDALANRGQFDPFYLYLDEMAGTGPGFESEAVEKRHGKA